MKNLKFLIVFYLLFFALLSQVKAQKMPQNGLASFYADKFHGRKTASGELFNQQAMTAAHRSLEFGTWVKVTNLKNNRSVIVRINDRGPFVKGRIIDLSKRAAEKLGFIRQGVVKVRVELVDETGRVLDPPEKLPFKALLDYKNSRVDSVRYQKLF
jgi:rare lipoprotein A